MADTDEQIIRGFLNNFPLTEAAQDASSALDRILALTLPELPDGWEYDGVGFVTGGWTAAIQHKSHSGTKIIFSTTKIDERPDNPRAAVLQAIAKIRNQP